MDRVIRIFRIDSSGGSASGHGSFGLCLRTSHRGPGTSTTTVCHSALELSPSIQPSKSNRLLLALECTCIDPENAGIMQ